MKLNKIICAITYLIFSTCFSQKQNAIFSYNYNLKHTEDCTPTVLQMLKDAKENQSKIIQFEKGVYHFYNAKAYEEFCFISNHDDGLKKILFPIYDFDGLTIDGGESEFIFHGPMIPFSIKNSKDIKIKNMSIDWEMPFHSEALIVANNPEEHTFDIGISDEYPYEIRNNQLVFLKEGGYEHDLGASILFDPKTKGVKYNNDNYMSLQLYRNKVQTRFQEKIKEHYEIDIQDPTYKKRGREYSLQVKELKPGLLRITKSTKEVPPVGSVLVCKGTHGYDRIAPAFAVKKTKNLVLENINVYHTGGMGIIAEFSKNIYLHKFNVTLRKNSNRYVSSTADATHFTHCTGTIKIDACNFTNMLDDATNIHGMYMKVADKIANNKLGVTIGHFQQANADFAEKGDTIGLIRTTDSFDPYKELVLNSCEKISARYYILTFQQNIPSTIEIGDLVENIHRFPKVEITNCVVKNNRARGFLISTPKGTLIKNNYFSTMMSAILMPVEFRFWFESGRAENVTITENNFEDCAYGGAPFPLINITVLGTHKASINRNSVIFKNITITNNKFNTFGNYILGAENVSILIFKNNDIRNSNSWELNHPNLPSINIVSSDKVEIELSEDKELKIDTHSIEHSPKYRKYK